MKKGDKLDLLKDFSKMWDFKSNENDIIPKEKRVGYLDSSSIIMIIPKLKSIKKLIEDNFDINNSSKIPKLNYLLQIVEGGEDKIKVYSRLVGEKTEYKENEGRYSPDYLKLIIKLCSKTSSKAVTIKLRNDYPLWVETDEMICVIAPIVGED